MHTQHLPKSKHQSLANSSFSHFNVRKLSNICSKSFNIINLDPFTFWKKQYSMLPKPYQYSHEIIYIIPKLPPYFHQDSFPFHRAEITKHNFVQKFISNPMSIDFSYSSFISSFNHAPFQISFTIKI